MTLRMVATHADHWNVWGGPQLFRSLPELRRDLDRFIREIAPAFR